MKTQTIAGYEITLEEGVRYQAHRPACIRGNISRQRFTITITRLNGGNDPLDYANIILGQKNVTETIPNLTYGQANQFLAEFNNEECSLSGRVW